MVELVDTPALGAGEVILVEVQVLSAVPFVTNLYKLEQYKVPLISLHLNCVILIRIKFVLYVLR